MEDIFVKDNKCPICEKELFPIGIGSYNLFNRNNFYCKNKCFYIDLSTNYTTYTIFDDQSFTFINSKTYPERQIKLIQDLIDFYKNDYRYLAEILTQN